MPHELELLLRLAIAAVIGGIVGTERELAGQPAGLRTHMLLTIGACLFTLVSAYAFAGSDPTRIAAQVVSGIGFLGGGAILRHGLSVRGITTAASIWATCALGVAIGSGMYVIGIGGAALVLATLVLLRAARDLLQRRGITREVLVVRARPGYDPTAVLDLAAREKLRILSIEHEHHAESDELTILAKLPRGYQPERLVASIGRLPGIQAVTWDD